MLQQYAAAPAMRPTLSSFHLAKHTHHQAVHQHAKSAAAAVSTYADAASIIAVVWFAVVEYAVSPAGVFWADTSAYQHLFCCCMFVHAVGDRLFVFAAKSI
jgi:hypothetical protein